MSKKLLIVAPYFYPQSGGLENYAYQMAKRALEQGYQVTVLTSTDTHKIEIEHLYGLDIYRLPIQFRLSNTPINLKWYWTIKEVLKKEKPDIINVHMPVPGLPDMVCMAAKNTKTIITYHAGSMKKGRLFIDGFLRAYERFFLPMALIKADKIICSSDFVKDNFLAKYQKKTQTITPGVDTSVFTKRTEAPNNRNILFIGNFNYEWKGIRHLLEALKQIPQATLHVVGAGRKIDSANTVYHGELSGQELLNQIHQAQVLVLPSTSEAESFGMVLIEAMACGTPVVGTDIGGIPTVVKDKVDGLLVKPKDTKALAYSISFILDNPHEAARLANNAYRKVVNNFTWDKSANKYLKLLNDLLNN
ncbi:MAG: glycosyltransferase family 1 protein [Actinobacteria bacterium]|nr:MAG: glycosyltransferase family 1 protein [Actinomycetota bacterium]